MLKGIMKVLIVHCGKGIYGGAEEVIIRLGRFLFKLNCEVAFVTRNIPYEVFRDLEGYSLDVVVCSSYYQMRREVQRRLGWADVINVHNFPATLAPFPSKKPIVWMCNEPAEMFTSWWREPIEAFNRRWIKKSGMKVVVADHFNARRFLDIYGVEAKVIPYGVDYGFWSNLTRERCYDSCFRMLQVGTVTPYKNQEESIRAVASLRKSIPNIELVLAGPIDADKEYYAKMEELATELEIRDLMSYTGNINREQLREWYYKADILLHPVKGQGGWLVPFEAMCAGLPVVTVCSFSASDMILGNGLGRVTVNLAEAVGDMVENRGAYLVMAQKGKRWVRENLTWEKFGASMVKVFEEAIGERCH